MAQRDWEKVDQMGFMGKLYFCLGALLTWGVVIFVSAFLFASVINGAGETWDKVTNNDHKAKVVKHG